MELETLTHIAVDFGLNLLSCWILVRLIYQTTAKRKDYVFTFMMVSSAVFLLCRVLSGVELDLAFALGLFAIFGIIRYRTNPVPIREMTYLFVVIALAVMNALAPMEAAWPILLLGNVGLLALAFLLDRVIHVEHLVTRRVIYDRVDLLPIEKRDELIADLESRIGVKIVRVEIGNVDLLRDTAVIKVSVKGELLSDHSNSANEL
jgi:hypothetical protein